MSENDEAETSKLTRCFSSSNQVWVGTDSSILWWAKEL